MPVTADASALIPILLKAWENTSGQGIYDEARKRADAGDYTPVQGGWMDDPKMVEGVNSKLRELGQQREAVPFLQRLADVKQAGMDNDPVWQQDAMNELNDLRGYNARKAPNNMIVQQGTQQTRDSLQNSITTAGIADRVQRGDTVPGMDLARLLQDKQGSAELEKLINLGKYNDELRSKRGVQDTINVSAGASNNPLLQALAKATQYGVNVGDFEKLTKTYGLDPVDLKTVEAGDAKGNDVKYVFNPRTGQTQGVVGMPQQAGRNASKTTVTINPEALAASAMKAFGPQVMNDTGKRFESAQKTAGLQRDYVTMYKLLESGTPTGWGQETVMQARRLAQAAGVKDINKLNNQQLFDSVTAMISTKAVRQTDANPTQKQIEMVMSKYPGLKKEQAVNLAQIQLGMQANSAEIRSHNGRLEGLKQLAGGNALGDAMVGQYNVSDPASGLILPADPIESMQKSPKFASSAKDKRPPLRSLFGR